MLVTPSIALECDAESVGRLVDREGGVVVDAGEESAADPGVEPGAGVAPPHVDPFARRAVIVPLDGAAMGGVLRRDAQTTPARSCGRTCLSRIRQMPTMPEPGDFFRPERRGQKRREHRRVHVIVDQDAPIDDAAHDGNSHDSSLGGSGRMLTANGRRNQLVSPIFRSAASL